MATAEVVMAAAAREAAEMVGVATEVARVGEVTAAAKRATAAVALVGAGSAEGEMEMECLAVAVASVDSQPAPLEGSKAAKVAAKVAARVAARAAAATGQG